MPADVDATASHIESLNADSPADSYKDTSSSKVSAGESVGRRSRQELKAQVQLLRDENAAILQQRDEYERTVHCKQQGMHQSFQLLRDMYDELKSEIQNTLWNFIPTITGPDFAELGTTDHTVFETSDRIGDYDLGCMLGEGQFSDVRRCTQASTKMEFAVKIMRKNKILSVSSYKRIQKEVSTLRKVDHTNIMQLFHVINSPTCIYLITEMGGRDLFDFFEKYSGKMDERVAREIVLGISRAVVYLHQQGICHRDLKPENVLLTQLKDGFEVNHENIRICDFGNCMDNIVPGFPSLTDLCGSPGFFAPEMILEGKKYDGAAADVWSLGCIMLELIRGQEDFFTIWLASYDYNLLQDESSFRGSIENAVHVVKGNLSDSSMHDFLRKFLVINPRERIASRSILVHPW